MILSFVLQIIVCWVKDMCGGHKLQRIPIQKCVPMNLVNISDKGGPTVCVVLQVIVNSKYAKCDTLYSKHSKWQRSVNL